jgi:hypothetical protein
MVASKHLIYIDETTFHKWQTREKFWVKPAMNICMPDTRGKSLTLIGAISEREGLIHYSLISGSNNSEIFTVFMQDLFRKVPKGGVYVMDNLQIHRSKLVMGLFDKKQEQFFLPPYSCALNPIERLWSVIKN